jgi:hypothetical protein
VNNLRNFLYVFKVFLNLVLLEDDAFKALKHVGVCMQVFECWILSFVYKLVVSIYHNYCLATHKNVQLSRMCFILPVYEL